jgi:hypothetical protein
MRGCSGSRRTKAEAPGLLGEVGVCSLTAVAALAVSPQAKLPVGRDRQPTTPSVPRRGFPRCRICTFRLPANSREYRPARAVAYLVMGTTVALRRLMVRDREVGGSNPLAPTVFRNKPFGESVEGPSHLHERRSCSHCFCGFPSRKSFTIGTMTGMRSISVTCVVSGKMANLDAERGRMSP